jgi:hypothetical protein
MAGDVNKIQPRERWDVAQMLQKGKTFGSNFYKASR